MSTIDRHEQSIECDQCGDVLDFWREEVDLCIPEAKALGWQVGTDVDPKPDLCPKCLLGE